MDRVMVSWNIPNLVTINLMAWLGFLAFTLIYQAFMRKKSTSSAPQSQGVVDAMDMGGGY